jgi:phage shock protein PspC (stress-responsive transcriptional regulator)
MDPVLVRVIFVVLALSSGSGILLYILLAIFVPKGNVPAPVSTGGPGPEQSPS